MFKRLFYRSDDIADLATTREKIKLLVAEHIRRLAIRRVDSITVDRYGNFDLGRWADEVKKFVDTIVRPQLTAAQLATLTDANLSLVANELIETPVRLECKRMHDFKERDMTIRVIERTVPERYVSTSTVTDYIDKTSRNSRQALVTRGLIIRQQPLELILRGSKTWEMRSSHTNIREVIGLICKGSKAVYGVAEIIDSKGPLSEGELLSSFVRHGISASRLDSPEVQEYKFAWVLHNIRCFRSPIPYLHKGGVKFVTFDAGVQDKIAQELVN